ncbi:diguanylate cyclase (GGDEF)-like protein [Oxalobacteraceae bacterium GrIS 2.11]
MTMIEPDLFDREIKALALAKSMRASAPDIDSCRRALDDLIAHYEQLLHESRRLIRRSDREELEMNQLNRRLNDLAKQLEYRATHDALTGVLNRGAFIDFASSSLALHDCALYVLDIDHFKQVNDDFGHPAGDEVIKSVAQHIAAVIRKESTIGRVGGEEFSIIDRVDALDTSVRIAQRICESVAAQEQPKPIDRRITLSIGVSWNPVGTDFASAYARADAALYEAKRSGRNQVRFSA